MDRDPDDPRYTVEKFVLGTHVDKEKYPEDQDQIMLCSMRVPKPDSPETFTQQEKVARSKVMVDRHITHPGEVT